MVMKGIFITPDDCSGANLLQAVRSTNMKVQYYATPQDSQGTNFKLFKQRYVSSFVGFLIVVSSVLQWLTTHIECSSSIL